MTEIETLWTEGDISSYMVKGDIDGEALKTLIINDEWLPAIPEHARVAKGWYRKVPTRDECGEYGGWMLHSATAGVRGAFFATQLIIYK